MMNLARRPKKWPKGIKRNYNDSVIFVSGNCGIGGKSLEYYQKMFAEFDKVLRNNNCFVFFIRGNNDNPSFFNGNEIDFEHVKAIPDYSVVELKNFNCLCIGGSVSFDREWKMAQESEFGRKLYWEDETPNFNEKEMDDILHEFKIGCVISSTCPTFAYPGTNSFNHNKWVKNNSEIKKLLSSERKTMDKVYDKMLDMETKPYAWLYGRFKHPISNKVNDIVFYSLAPYQIEDVCQLLIMNFGLDMSKKLGGNDFSFDSFLKTKKSIFDSSVSIDEDENEFEELDNEEVQNGGRDAAINGMNDIRFAPLENDIRFEPLEVGTQAINTFNPLYETYATTTATSPVAPAATITNRAVTTATITSNIFEPF